MKMQSESGFTIIELLVATTVFSVILIVTAATLIGISGTYVKGSVQGQTQQTARAILSDIASDIEFNKYLYLSDINVSSAPSSDEYYFCAGNDVYVYTLDKVESSTQWGLIRYVSPCPLTAPAVSGTPAKVAGSAADEELLGNNERIGQLDITQVNNSNAYQISIEVAAGNDSVLDDVSLNGAFADGGAVPLPSQAYQYRCQSGSDSSFCAVSTLTTTVDERITN